MKLRLLIALIVVSPVQAQVFKQPLSVQYQNLGAYSLNFSDIFSATANQASAAQLKTGSFGVYGEKRFLLEELNNYTAIIALPTTSGVFGFQGNYFGSSAFNENELGIFYARKITRNIDIGAKFNYYTVRTPGYGSASAINFEVGAIIHLTDKWHTGFHLYNPSGSRLGKISGEKLPFIYRLGIGYEASEMVFVSAEVVKQQNRPPGVNAGLQYNLQKNIFIRTGISTFNGNSYVSIGLPLGFARIDISAAYHPQLGFTPGLSLLMNFKNADKE